MNIVRRLVLVSWVVASAALAAGGAAPPSPRERKLQAMLMAPCCWSETVDQHRSEVAAEIRGEISTMVAEGKSDREILDYFIAKHGRRILAEPEGAQGLVVYTVPIVVLIAGAVLVVFAIRRMLRAGAAAA